MMGYRTPNIDRIASEGAIFTDSYGQQSCTAGRASFILGQEPFRTGLLTIGMPGDPHGIQDWMPTIADVMKTKGYATGQFGKNHLGDHDEHLPTKHGFDEFIGNLYQLNAEEEPEGYFYPKDPEFKKKFGLRGVIKSSADGKIEDTGPLTTKRMETVDEEFLPRPRISSTGRPRPRSRASAGSTRDSSPRLRGESGGWGRLRRRSPPKSVGVAAEASRHGRRAGQTVPRPRD